MKIADRNNNIQRSGKFEEVHFRIATNAKAFDILSSKLYSEPIKAIVRELSTNAWDAHVEAGKPDIPIDVHLPSGLSPSFWIRDYGTGMSHRQIMSLYTTYFESTKTHTNDLAGCFGLGSKSPFSYTENFFVTSWYRGKKRSYSMFVGEQGFPTVALLNTIDSDEPAGLKVELPSNTEDHNSFIKAAIGIYSFFPTKPNFIGVVPELPSIEKKDGILVEREGWRVYKTYTSYSSPSPENIALIGPVGYPLSFSHAGIASPIAMGFSLQIQFDIGELEVTASREELNYSERTNEAIKKRVNKIFEELLDIVTQDALKEKSRWKRALNLSLISGIFGEKGARPWDRSYYYRNPFEIPEELAEKTIQLESLLGETDFSNKTYFGNAVCLKIRLMRGGGVQVINNDSFYNFRPNKNVHLYQVTDKAKPKDIATVKQDLKKKEALRRKEGGDPHSSEIKGFIFSLGIEEDRKALEDLGLEEVDLINIRDLEAPARGIKRKKTSTVLEVTGLKLKLLPKGGSGYYHTFKIETAGKIDLEPEAHFLVYKGKAIFLDIDCKVTLTYNYDNYWANRSEKEALATLIREKDPGITSIPIFKYGDVKRILKVYPKWKPFEKKLQELLNQTAIQENGKIAQVPRSIIIPHIEGYYDRDEILRWLQIIGKKLSKNHPLNILSNDLSQSVDEDNTDRETLVTAFKALLSFVTDITLKQPKNPILSRLEVLLEEYPYLGSTLPFFTSRCTGKTEKLGELISFYIKAKDKELGKDYK